MAHVHGLRCRECGREYEVAPIFTCEWCFGPLEVAYDYDAITRVDRAARRSRRDRSSIWRYADLLPVDRNPAVDLGAGFTPLVRADRLAAELGLGEVWIKNDTLNPTNSFKDRVTSVALSKALEFGFKVAACASTGNLANSVAAHAAHAGLRSFVFIPADLEQGKVVTTAVYGGNVVAIDGNYDDVNRLCAELAGTYPWAFVNVNVRTVLRRGLEDARVRDRRAARLGGARPRGRARSRAARCSPRSARASTSCTRSACSTRSRRCGCRARRPTGCSPVATAWLDERRHHQAGEARHDRQVARDRQPGRRLLRARRRAPDRRWVRRGHRRRDRRRHAAARPHRGDLRRDRGRRDHRDAEAARRRGRRAARRAGRRLHHRPRAEDARRGRADASARPRRSRPTLDAFHEAFATRSDELRPRGATRMAVTVRIPTQLRELSGGAAEVSVEGGTRRRGARRRSRPRTPASPSGSSTSRASCAASSTCSSPTRTSASSTASTRRSTDGATVSIVPAVAGG